MFGSKPEVENPTDPKQPGPKEKPKSSKPVVVQFVGDDAVAWEKTDRSSADSKARQSALMKIVQRRMPKGTDKEASLHAVEWCENNLDKVIGAIQAKGTLSVPLEKKS